MEAARRIGASEAEALLREMGELTRVMKRRVYRAVISRPKRSLLGFRLEVYQSDKPVFAVMKTASKRTDRELLKPDWLKGLKFVKDISGHYEYCSFMKDFLEAISKDKVVPDPSKTSSKSPAKELLEEKSWSPFHGKMVG